MLDSSRMMDLPLKVQNPMRNQVSMAQNIWLPVLHCQSEHWE